LPRRPSEKRRQARTKSGPYESTKHRPKKRFCFHVPAKIQSKRCSRAVHTLATHIRDCPNLVALSKEGQVSCSMVKASRTRPRTASPSSKAPLCNVFTSFAPSLSGIVTQETRKRLEPRIDPDLFMVRKEEPGGII
jgi:hypothetical protein